MLYWGIDFLNGTKPFGFSDFEDDQIIFYNGMYDIPAHIVWWARSWPEKPVQISLGSIFLFFTYDQFGKVAYIDYFIIQNFYFDVTKSMWRIYAVNGSYYLLSNTKAQDYHQGSADPRTPISGFDIIKKLVEGLFRGKYEVIKDEVKLVDIVQYVHISLDLDMSILDLITKICKENRWEWYLGPDALYIGQSLYVNQFVRMNEPDKEEAKIASNFAYTAVTLESLAAEPMVRYGNKGKVIWTEHYLNNEGGEMTLFILNQVGSGTLFKDTLPEFTHITNNDFYDTLHGIALDYARLRKNQMFYQNPILVGKMHGTVLSKNLENYEAPQFGGDIDNLTKNLNTLKFKKDLKKGNRFLKNVKMTTPYAGDGVGMLFPQSESHRTLLTPNGEREIALIGPAYFGPGDKIPERTYGDDFRLQLPGGWCLYVDTVGHTILQVNNVDSTTIPDELDSLGMSFNPSIEGKKEFKIYLDNSTYFDITDTSNGIARLSAEGSMLLNVHQGDILINSDLGNIGAAADSIELDGFDFTIVKSPNKVEIKVGGIPMIVVTPLGGVEINGRLTVSDTTLFKAPITVLGTATIGGQTVPVKVPP